MQPQSRGVHEFANRDKKIKTKGDDWWMDDGVWNGDEEYPYLERAEGEEVASE